MKKYSWPGNIRELASVVEKHLIQASGPIIRPEDLDLKLYESESISSSLTLAALEDQHNQVKISYILQTIEDAGSKAEAARRLGIKPTHLQYLLNQSKAAKRMDTNKENAET